ncbi:MAG TPA: MerC domain-containing protein [Ignavibacteria bacterium]|nr:MerC domain-containing protein [Ignavibacteria bacterium]
MKHELLQKLDLLGLSASTICAVHCALLPFVIVMLPLIGLEFLANPVIEYSVIALSFFIGLFTLKSGYFEHHGKLTPFILFLCGLIIIIIGHLFFHTHDHHEAEHSHFLSDEILFLMIAPTGAILIASAHFINRKWTKTKCSKKH